MYFDENDEGETIVVNDVHMFYVRGDEAVATYSPVDFCWDSNAWGTNHARHKELGLLELPHALY